VQGWPVEARPVRHWGSRGGVGGTGGGGKEGATTGLDLLEVEDGVQQRPRPHKGWQGARDRALMKQVVAVLY